MTGFELPSDLADRIKVRLVEDHSACNTAHIQKGGCHLADLSRSDVQEILNIAKELGE